MIRGGIEVSEIILDRALNSFEAYFNHYIAI